MVRKYLSLLVQDDDQDSKLPSKGTPLLLSLWDLALFSPIKSKPPFKKSLFPSWGKEL